MVLPEMFNAVSVTNQTKYVHKISDITYHLSAQIF